jgi:hypothetical protein
MHSSVPRQRLFLGAVPITSRYYLQEYNATEAVSITSRYYLEDYITLHVRIICNIKKKRISNI